MYSQSTETEMLKHLRKHANEAVFNIDRYSDYDKILKTNLIKQKSSKIEQKILKINKFRVN